MTAIKYKVNLTQDQRQHLLDMSRRGKPSARKVRRALILCKAAEGLSDRQISEALLVGSATVSRVRKRFVEEGMEAALSERPRPGKRPKLNGRQQAHLVAVACTKAPEGHTHWTLALLADKVVELEFAESISLETVRKLLKKTSLSPGRRRSGAFQRSVASS